MATARTARRTGSARQAADPSTLRWAALALGLAAAGAALWVLARDAGEAPLGDIDADSRARLEGVLERADREGAR